MNENLLFVCAHCFKRFPFNDLTGDNHYCKSCYRITLRRCCYCQCSFSPENNSQETCISCNNSIIKCGLPRSCKMCKLKAAFKGGKCKRCYRYCVRYGEPRKCSQCRCRAAFIKNLADLQFDSKLKCWLCTHGIKRSPSQSKTKKNNKNRQNNNNKHRSEKALLFDPLKTRITTTIATPSSLLSPTPTPTPLLSYIVTKPMLLSTLPAAEAINVTTATTITPTPPSSSPAAAAAATTHMSLSPSLEYVCANDDVNEKNTPEALASVNNGGTMMTLDLPEIIPKSLMIDPFSSEHLIAMTELKDTVAALEKRVFIQNKQLIEKDKLLNQLRAEMGDREKDLRQQLREMNSCHMNELGDVNRKIHALTKENASLKKTVKDIMKKSINLKKK